MQTNWQFSLQQFTYAAKGLFPSPDLSFLGVILDPEEFVSRLIHSVYNIQLFSEEPGWP